MNNDFSKKVVAKLRKNSIEREESKAISESLGKITDRKKRNEMLQKIITERAMDKKEVQELMYDLTHTHKMLNLEKPKTQTGLQVTPQRTAKKEEHEVLFKIKTKDVEIKINGKDEVLKGGHIFDVVAFEKGKFYVTNKEHKPGVPQLIPWSMAEKI